MVSDKLLPLAAAAAVLGLAAIAAPVAPTATAAATDAATDAETVARTEVAQDACCFQNPAYTGTCEVEPEEGETCASILAYLNNPMSQGKSYCGGTTLRQGWTQVSCEEGGAAKR